MISKTGWPDDWSECLKQSNDKLESLYKLWVCLFFSVASCYILNSLFFSLNPTLFQNWPSKTGLERGYKLLAVRWMKFEGPMYSMVIRVDNTIVYLNLYVRIMKLKVCKKVNIEADTGIPWFHTSLDSPWNV